MNRIYTENDSSPLMTVEGKAPNDRSGGFVKKLSKLVLFVMLGFGFSYANASIGLNPTSVDFGERIVGSFHDRFILVDNLMGVDPISDLNIFQTGADEGFKIRNTCPQSLNIGDACQVAVIFNPTKAIPYNDVILVKYKVNNKPKTVIIQLDGRGI